MSNPQPTATVDEEMTEEDDFLGDPDYSVDDIREVLEIAYIRNESGNEIDNA